MCGLRLLLGARAFTGLDPHLRTALDEEKKSTHLFLCGLSQDISEGKGQNKNCFTSNNTRCWISQTEPKPLYSAPHHQCHAWSCTRTRAHFESHCLRFPPKSTWCMLSYPRRYCSCGSCRRRGDVTELTCRNLGALDL